MTLLVIDSKIDHRNDIAVNLFGLIMAITGDRFEWYLDPIGAICIALIILFSWTANAFEQVWLLVGKSAPREFVNKLIYISMTHDERILKVDTVSSIPSPSVEILFGTSSFAMLIKTFRVSAVHTMLVKSITARSTWLWMNLPR